MYCMYMRMQMCILDATSKWASESEWIDCNSRVCVSMTRPNENLFPIEAGTDMRWMLVYLLVYMLVFRPRLRYRSRGKVYVWYVYMWTRYEVFLFDWKYAPHLISLIEAAKEVCRLKVTEERRRYNPLVRPLMTNGWIWRVLFALSLIGV